MWAVILCIKVIEISFSDTFNEEIHALKGFYYDFSSLDPCRGAAPWILKVASPL